ncbi:MAG: hypothetical protein ACTIKR_07165 [Advenella sp.]|uniref:Uncharacterized protein n=1 Tax=Advenella kashmirensis TaxID=310575 RepID=A0A356LKS2_9BURK|nr:hypothetical protein [Advenella sp. FME57]HBP31171.1 hypothetical protein [Advenella kashmirensis]
MKNTDIATLASAVALALGMHSAMAADMTMDAEGKVSQKPAQQAGAGPAPTSGWEKLSKNKNWKPAAPAADQRHHNDMKSKTRAAP